MKMVLITIAIIATTMSCSVNQSETDETVFFSQVWGNSGAACNSATTCLQSASNCNEKKTCISGGQYLSNEYQTKDELTSDLKELDYNSTTINQFYKKIDENGCAVIGLQNLDNGRCAFNYVTKQ